MTNHIPRLLVLSLLLLACATLALSSARAQADQPLALVMTADGPVMPPMLEYIRRGIQAAEQREAEVLIIELDTPGGDLMTTLDIIAAIRASRVPVVVYVAPRNAIAGSAGALITMSAHASASHVVDRLQKISTCCRVPRRIKKILFFRDVVW